MDKKIEIKISNEEINSWSKRLELNRESWNHENDHFDSLSSFGMLESQISLLEKYPLFRSDCCYRSDRNTPDSDIMFVFLQPDIKFTNRSCWCDAKFPDFPLFGEEGDMPISNRNQTFYVNIIEKVSKIIKYTFKTIYPFPIKKNVSPSDIDRELILPYFQRLILCQSPKTLVLVGSGTSREFSEMLRISKCSDALKVEWGHKGFMNKLTLPNMKTIMFIKTIHPWVTKDSPDLEKQAAVEINTVLKYIIRSQFEKFGNVSCYNFGGEKKVDMVSIILSNRKKKKTKTKEEKREYDKKEKQKEEAKKKLQMKKEENRYEYQKKKITDFFSVTKSRKIEEI